MEIGILRDDWFWLVALGPSGRIHMLQAPQCLILHGVLTAAPSLE